MSSNGRQAAAEGAACQVKLCGAQAGMIGPDDDDAKVARKKDQLTFMPKRIQSLGASGTGGCC